ncbi:hypothetical protein LJY25_17615 [Hymenobacter sp. BT175]|uniref:hypothetical protein n=1 Tax=Hymenobacter translucens TaxID=2886507 RepID=UPI001D0F2F03|nr:hypothetical protein [Hymenobacter translucens]MCC2548272.1 hypothetical protein [Hymenobacter translucens]
MKVRLLMLGLGLVGGSSFQTSPAPEVRRTIPVPIAWQVNGRAIAPDSSLSRLELTPGPDRTFSLTLVSAVCPDDPGLTIILDQFKLTPAIYRFKDVLSGHIRDAAYRCGPASAYSTACGRNEGYVQVSRVDAQRRVVTGTFHCVVCDTDQPAASPNRRLVMTGNFRLPYNQQ